MDAHSIIVLVLQVIALAMGIVTIVLGSFQKEIDSDTQTTFLGIGLTAIAMAALLQFYLLIYRESSQIWSMITTAWVSRQWIRIRQSKSESKILRRISMMSKQLRGWSLLLESERCLVSSALTGRKNNYDQDALWFVKTIIWQCFDRWI